MLPDFSRVKREANRRLTRWVEEQVPIVAPLMAQVRRFRQHEGKTGALSREDGSTATLDYPVSEFRFDMTRSEMKRADIAEVQRKLANLAERIGQEQTKRLLERVGDAASAVGNSINAGGELTPEIFLELFRRVQMDFDPRTGQPSGHVFVMHPDTAAKIAPKVKE